MTKIFTGVGDVQLKHGQHDQEQKKRDLEEARRIEQEYKEKREAQKAEIQRQFLVQLNEFANADFSSEYSRFTPIGGKVLVKLFNFKPEIDGGIGESLLWVQSPLNAEWRQEKETITSKVFPIVKIIKVGIGTWGEGENAEIPKEFVAPGKMFTVPYMDVIGESWNQDFLHLVNTFSGKAGTQGKLINIPDGMPQKLSNLEINWAGYKFSMPDRLFGETEDDKLTYLIPVIKLKSIYEPPELNPVIENESEG